MSEAVNEEIRLAEDEAVASQNVISAKDSEKRIVEQLSKLKKEETAASDRVARLIIAENEAAAAVEKATKSLNGAQHTFGPSMALRALLGRDGISVAANEASMLFTQSTNAHATAKKALYIEKEKVKKLEKEISNVELNRRFARQTVVDLQVAAQEAQQKRAQAIQKVTQAQNVLAACENKANALQLQYDVIRREIRARTASTIVGE